MMNTTRYEQIAGLVSHIRNARYGEMVKYSEELIDSGAWRDFTTPIGTHFQFEACEFDYFLAAQEIDATTLRHAYVHAAEPTKLMRLADITGKGSKTDDRRPREDVAKEYDSDPAGAGMRIREWAGETVVTERTARLAANSRLRKDYIAGKIKRARPQETQWKVTWSDADKSTAQAIADKLLVDPDLAHEVYKLLHAGSMRATRAEQKRRSQS